MRREEKDGVDESRDRENCKRCTGGLAHEEAGSALANFLDLLIAAADLLGDAPHLVDTDINWRRREARKMTMRGREVQNSSGKAKGGGVRQTSHVARAEREIDARRSIVEDETTASGANRMQPGATASRSTHVVGTLHPTVGTLGLAAIPLRVGSVEDRPKKGLLAALDVGGRVRTKGVDVPVLISLKKDELVAQTTDSAANGPTPDVLVENSTRDTPVTVLERLVAVQVGL